MTALLATVALFGLSFAGMAVGVIVKDTVLRGSCGGGDIHAPDGSVISCGACPKKEATVCPSDDRLVAIAQFGHPDPDHHRPAVY